jgi:MFS family permease
MALNLVVAAAGSIVIVNTVNHVRDELGGSQADVAWMLAASGGGALLVALALPRVLDRLVDRTVMMTGAVVLAAGTVAAVALSATELLGWVGTAMIWLVIGAGMALIVTPTGRVLRGWVKPNGLPEVFAAQFSLSHLAWLITYPIAGWMGTNLGFTVTWSVLAILAIAGAAAARSLWPRRDAFDRLADPAQSEPQLRDDTGIAAGTLAGCKCTAAHVS